MLVAPPIDFAAIRTTLCDVLAVGTGLPLEQIVMAEPEEAGAPIPDFPFIMFQFTTIAMMMANDCFSTNGSPDGWQLSGPRQASVTLDCYAQTHDEAYNIGALLQAALIAPPAAQMLTAANLAIWDIGPVVDLSALLSTGFEGRARVDVKMGLASVLNMRLATIQAVPLFGTVTTDGGQVTIAATIPEV